MTDRNTDIEAAEFVLGTLDRDARRAFKRRMAGDPAIQSDVEAWEERLAGLEGDGAAIPPADVWARIDTSLSDVEALPDRHVVRAGDGLWRTIAPGVEHKLLYVDKSAGAQSYLLRLAPGASLPAHLHTMAEDCIVMSGETVLAGIRFQAGDYHCAFVGASHPELTSDTGAVLFVRGAIAA